MSMTATVSLPVYDTEIDSRDPLARLAQLFDGSDCELLNSADDGEVLIKGANIFKGYYKNDDASFGAVIDGWLHTGDLGSIDADGGGVMKTRLVCRCCRLPGAGRDSQHRRTSGRAKWLRGAG